MRLRYVCLLALLPAACNSILGNSDHYVLDVSGSSGDGSGGSETREVPCHSNSNCDAGGETPGSSAAGAGSSAAGAGGAPEPPKAEPCVGTRCEAPLAASCTSASELKTYDPVGSCSEGECTYTEHLIACNCQDGECDSDPCLAAPPCDSPPQDSCKDAATKTTYATDGTCSAGACRYTATDEDCGANQRCSGAGVCSPCISDASCGASCGACSGTTKRCRDLGSTSKCVTCLSSADCSAAAPFCDTTTNVCGPTPPIPPSCVGLVKTCGPTGGGDCCASSLVTGGTSNRDNNPGYPATVSDFRLDNYEITVGRFRKFVAVYSQDMTNSGAGKNLSNPSDPGWDKAWDASLESTSAALMTGLTCGTHPTWTDTAISAGAESLPLTCLTWFEAQAFCIWDGGRLPTEAEWSHAAVGGAQQRAFPWGNAAPDCSYANFRHTEACLPGGEAPNRVGSESSKGDGFYGQSDLYGNLWEWVQDLSAFPYPAPCNDCARLAPMMGQSFPNRVARGGYFGTPREATTRSQNLPTARSFGVGARCARPPL